MGVTAPIPVALHPHLQSRWSDRRVVAAERDVKSWDEGLPDVEAVRPARCPCCGTAGRPAGAPLGLIGHGIRRRHQLGPSDVGERPEVAEVIVRRYRCRGCGAVVTVVPRGVAPRVRYRLAAVAWALGRWWQGVSAAEVRREVSPFVHVGEEARRGWRSLRRWVEMLGSALGLDAFGPPRRRVERVLQQLAARALEASGELVGDAVAGVVLVDVHRLCRGGPEVPTT